MANEIEIAIPDNTNDMNTSTDVSYGVPIPKLKRLEIIDEDSWEDLTLELVHYCWKKDYSRIVRCGGGGDMGRDVIAYKSGLPSKEWENFQCKHYNSKLNLSQALLEIGKLFYYSYKGNFSIPIKYYFVSPLGVSTDLLNHLMNSENLKKKLIFNWNRVCEGKITKKSNTSLSSGLLGLIQRTDFIIFEHLPPMKIIELHEMTPAHLTRFGGMSKKRPKPQEPPKMPLSNESIFINELFSAFGDAEGSKVSNSNLSTFPDYNLELKSARINFYCAEDLHRFSRDWLPQNTYQELIDECYESVSSVTHSAHINAYEKFLATSAQASKTDYVSHPLHSYIKIQDKKGMCHQLVNLKKITWVKK